MSTMKKEDVIFERKEFLNLPGHNGMANIVTSIVKQDWRSEETDKDGKELYHEVYVKLDFADCDRRVSMDMSLDSIYERENTLHKVDTLIEVLSEFREELVKQAKYQNRLEKRRERHKEDEKKKENE